MKNLIIKKIDNSEFICVKKIQKSNSTFFIFIDTLTKSKIRILDENMEKITN